MNLVKTLVAACVLALLSACANGTTTVIAPPGQQTARPTFQTFQISQGEHSVAFDADQIALFERELRTRLAAPGGFQEGDGLMVRFRVVQYERGSQALRYIVGFGAGRGSLTIEVVYLDSAGAELARINVGGDISVGLFGGGFGEATTRAAQEAADYAREHFRS